MKTISILDYGLGNCGSVLNMLNYLKQSSEIISTKDELLKSSCIVIPGVGSYDEGMNNIHNLGFKQILDDLAKTRKIPILGICLGMQLMLNGSKEGSLDGLGWIDGYVDSLKGITNNQVPHMGWNYVNYTNRSLDLNDSQRYYFVHSYFANNVIPDKILCLTKYGESCNFVSGIIQDNLIGVQFHPEKSHQFGITFFEKWINPFQLN